MLRLLVTDIYQKLRLKSIYLLIVSIVNSLFEGLALTLLFPLLAAIGIGASAETNSITLKFTEIANYLHINFSLQTVLLLIVLMFAIQNLIFLYQSHLSAKYRASYISQWKNAIFNACLRSNWLYYTTKNPDQMISYIHRETERVNSCFFIFVQVLTSVFYVLAYLAVAFMTSKFITFGLIAMGALLYVTTRPLSKRSETIGKAMTENNIKLQSTTNETFKNFKLIKSTVTENKVANIFNQCIEKYFALNYRSTLNPSLSKCIFDMVSITLLCAVLGIAIGHYHADTASVIITLLIFLRLFSRLSTFPPNIQTMTMNLPSLQRLLKFESEIATEHEIIRNIENRDIHFKQLTIANGCLALNGQPILNHVNFTINHGTITAIVGKSGAGKSTLADTILSLISLDSGQICIDGVALDNFNLQEWRKSVAYVSQNVHLFNTTIKENILWGNEHADAAALQRVLKSSKVDTFLDKLANGIDTHVGDQGICLSGGQKQRIALARALLAHKNLIILDEATSNLDVMTEQAIMQDIHQLRGDYTMLIIAHRLPTVKNADVIYVMDKGRMIESGTYDELMEKEGDFKELWECQAI